MKKLILFVLLIAAVQQAQAQYYILPWINAGRNPGSLNAEAEGLPSTLPAGWLSILSGPKATPAWSVKRPVPSGFNFTFNGQPVSYFKVSSTGVMTFDTSAVNVPSANNTALPSAEIPNNSICVWGISATGTTDNILVKTFGTAPNRQLWIQFNDFSETALGSSGYTYWSIVLEESTNKIYLVDHRTNCTTAGCKLSLTLGLQFDATKAIQVAESPNVVSYATNGTTAADNSFYEFATGSQPSRDMYVKSVNLKRYYARKAGDISITGELSNFGTDVVTNMILAYSVNNASLTLDTIKNLSIASGKSYTYTHSKKWSPELGDKTIRVWVANINGGDDLNNANDTAFTLITVLDTLLKRKVLHESFTSSTCPPCNPGNATLTNVINQRSGSWAAIKYQYYFPGTGDPYFTNEGLARGSFYGSVNAIPETKVDGSLGLNPNGYNLATFDARAIIPALISVLPQASLKDNRTVNATVMVNPYIDYKAGLKLYMAICEKKTTKNIKTNGETEFHHVFKKFINGTNGFTLPEVKAGQPQTFTGSWTFKGDYRLPKDGQTANIINDNTEHSVEEFSDLELVAFLQDPTTREVLQAETVDITGFTATDEFALNDHISVFPNPANDGFRIRFDELDLNQSTTLQVTDLAGKTLLNAPIRDTESYIQTNSWAPGMYLLHIRSGKEQAVGKILIQR